MRVAVETLSPIRLKIYLELLTDLTLLTGFMCLMGGLELNQ
jgi:hypothetical protein